MVLKAGLVVTNPCQQMLEQMVITGVTRMDHQQALELADKLQLAEENLNALVRMMARRSEESGMFPTIDEDAFQSALKELCPLWPFC